MFQNVGRRPSHGGAIAVIVVLAVLSLAVSPLLAGGASRATSGVTDMWRIELLNSNETALLLNRLGVASAPAGRPGYVTADVTASQRQELDRRGVQYDHTESFLLVRGEALSGEGSVVGSQSGDVNILGNQTVNSFANVAGAPAGKTIIRADVGVDIKYPAACNLYVMVWHPSNVMWFHAWNGNQNPCTANLNKQWLGIHDFDFADINGQWKLTVQETDGKTQGFVDYWFIRLYYQDDSTPTRTPTRTATATPTGPSGVKVFLPVIISAFQ
jgi:subtilisin-like proprotein convertase family protein